MLDKEKWSIEDLLRYSALLKKQLDAQVLPEGALSDDEVRQLEKYRLRHRHHAVRRHATPWL